MRRLILSIFIFALVTTSVFAQTPQPVFLQELSNGERVEVYAGEGARSNGMIHSKMIIQGLDSQGDGTGVTDMSIAPIIITGATNATPIVITSVAHTYLDGDHVWISAVAGNTAANGYRKVANKADDTFEITDYGDTDIVGNGAYTSGGVGFLSFVFEPGSDEIAVLRRMVGYAHNGTYNSMKYFGIDALPNGISVEIRDATSLLCKMTGPKNVSIWLQWSLQAGVDIGFKEAGGGTQSQASIRWTFALGPGNLRIDGTLGQVLVLVIRDDMSGLYGQEFTIQGFLK